MKKLFTLLVLLVAIVTGAQAQTTATFEGDNLNITSSSKTVNGVTLSNNGTDWSYQSGLYTGGAGKTFNLSVANGTISQILITISGTSNRFTNTNITNCTSCTRDGSVYTLVINPATSTVAVKNNGGGVTVTKIEVTYTLSGPQDPSFTVPSEIVVGETGTITGPSGLNFTATVKSGSEYVSVDGATITANAIGNAVINVSSGAVADTWNEFSQDYNVSVVDEPVAPTSGEIFKLELGSTALSGVSQNVEINLSPTYATVTNGTAYIGNKNSSSDKAQIDASKGVYYNGNDAYVKIELGTALAKGDVISFTNPDTSNRQVCFTKTNTRTTTYPTVSNEFTCGDEFEGATTLYVWRIGSSTYLKTLTITRPAVATETYTVTFNAGSNGTCATASLTEATPGAGVELPAVTANEGYTFDGWFTAATDGTKVGNAGDIYKPSADVEIFAQYLQLAAPSISVTPTAPSTYLGVATTLTAEVTGAPNPTVKWYKNTGAATTGGTEVGTGLTYQPDVTTEGIFYYYAVAANGVEPSATSELVTLTVTDPNENITGNSYYIETGDVKVGGAKVFGQDITMQYTGFEGGSSAAVEDNMLNGVNSNYVASVSHSSANGWGTEFVATKNGTLSVGVIINGGKTFTLTNVTSFDYNGVQDEGNNETSESAGTNTSNTWKPSKKQWTVLTFDVVAGTTYKLSVAGSKMGFYGFEFTPTLTLTDAEGSTNATAIAALNGKTANVTVSRTLSNSYYNTLFLPFAMTADQVTAAFGEGVQVATFSGMNSDTQFGFANVTAMEANTGYLVKPAAVVNGFTVEGVTITTAASVTPSSDWIMYGSYDTFENSPTNEVYYFTIDGKVKKLASDGSIKGLRAFMMKGATEETVKAINTNVSLIFGGGSSEPAQARADFFLFLDGGTTTGINSIENGQIDNDAPAYNLAGQKVGKGYKGIVIINGKKVVK